MIFHIFSQHLIEGIRSLEKDKSVKISNLNDLWQEMRKLFIEKFSSDFSSTSFSMHQIDMAGLDKISEIVTTYCAGNVSGALRAMKDLLFDSSGKYLYSIYSWRNKGKDGKTNPVVSYRMRACDDYKRFTREELFHAPFDNLKNVGTQRYSMIGFPCLYLGESLYNCWEEIKRPDLEKVNFARYVHYDTLDLLDLVFPPDYKDEKDFVQAAIVMMCSKSVSNEDAKFKYEYVFPQLILQSMIENCKKYSGIRYLSTKYINGQSLFPDNADIMMNYVIPVKAVTSTTKYCKELCSIFKLTEPKAYFIDFLSAKVPVGITGATGYQRSVLSAYEEELKGQEVKMPEYQ